MNNICDIYSPNVSSCIQFVMGKETVPLEAMKEQNFAHKNFAKQF